MSREEQQEITILNRKRGMIKAKITKFGTYLDSLSTGTNVFEFKDRLEKAESTWHEFENVQERIELLIDDDSQSTQRDQFEDSYYSVIPRAKQLLAEHENRQQLSARTNSALEGTNQSNSNYNHNSGPQINVKLPTLQLPEFSGDYDKWLHFRDTFNALINQNQSLTNIQKFHYLRSCLKNSALQVINSLQTTDANYIVAWEALEKRFEKKRIIVNSHVKALFDLPQVPKESSAALRRLYDHMNQHIRALKILGEPTDKWDTLLIYLMSAKLDLTSKREWEKNSMSFDTPPKLEDFAKFVDDRCQFLESVAVDTQLINKLRVSNTHGKGVSSMERARSHAVVKLAKCEFCKGSHYIYNCSNLLKLPVKQRCWEIKRLKLCSNCLRSSHMAKECKSRGCKTCNGRHNSLLHFNETADFVAAKSPEINQNNNSSDLDCPQNPTSSRAHITSTHLRNDTSSAYVLLATANVLIFDANGVPHSCRALLDNGSQPNFMTKDLHNKLGLPDHSAQMSINGINHSVTSTTRRTYATIKSMYNNYRCKLPFHIVPQITDTLPDQNIDISTLAIPNNISLADPLFHQCNQIDILIGASIFWDLLCVGQVQLNKHKLILQKSKLGWIISGPIAPGHPNSSSKCNLVTQNEIMNQIETFWRIEECFDSPVRSIEENECEDHFERTTVRDESGRFIVKLPFRDNINKIGGSVDIATKRFHSLEKKFERNTTFRSRYVEFMKEYENLGHMSKVNPILENNDGMSYYLPHHGILKESSSTTKLRVVFDASAKTSSNLSLNDTLKVGPVLQDDLFTILTRFRVRRYAVIADVEKMYRQVNVAKPHRTYQRILWREDKSKPLEHYELNTVTYGTAPASFLAIRALQQTTKDCLEQHPIACEVILSDFYVDDLLTGVDSISDGRALVSELDTVLKTGGFHLRKWISNEPRILQHIQDQSGIIDHQISIDENTRTLGLVWNSSKDSFHFDVQINDGNSREVTKRSILSVLSRIFDPLGLISPIVIVAKIIMQRVWQVGIGWDESVPTDLFTIWTRFLEQVKRINYIQVPRYVICVGTIEIQGHGFCDASESAYGACIYLRATDSHRNVVINLLCAKSRVAPIKSVSLPRLELCGALLLSRLYERVIGSLKLSISQSYFWCDSTIVLAWLKCEPNRLKTFVANRVAEIQKRTQVGTWHHVISEHNPADIVSRGSTPEKLTNSLLWWNGPDWLRHDMSQWPLNKNLTLPVAPEQKRACIISASNIINHDIFNKFSTFTKLVKVVAYCIRFLYNSSKRGTSYQTTTLSPHELDASIHRLAKMVQAATFASDLQSLKTKGKVSSSSRLLTLNPFLDEGDLIRVGGRLKHSKLDYYHKYPIVLPSNHPFTRMIIVHEHVRLLHVGMQGTLASVRARFWPLNARNVVRKVLRNCITCFRINPRNLEYKMGNLPELRLRSSRPFLVVGIDFAGPLYIKDGKMRNRKIIKAYLCVFVCFSSKAVHLELVGELTTDSFLNALKRFVSRRGLCRTIYSDNGTNFVGANNELKEVSSLFNDIDGKDQVSHFLTHNNINWKFMPPRAPNFGGLWESCVKSAKHHLKRIVGNAHLTFEGLYTIITQIEAVLNSRPLLPLSSDPNDLEPLTPSHFLIGEVLTAVPQQDVTGIPENRLNNYEHLQQLLQHFWMRWRNEYLSHLQQRTKWKKDVSVKVKPGLMVILKEDNLPPLSWRMGRIVDVHPGSDDITRVVSVKTVNGIVKRPLSRVCLMPMEDYGQ